MFILFFKIKSGKKGQLATFLTIVLIVFIMLAFIVVNLGKIGLQRTRQANAADAATLAAGSQAARLLNYMATFNEEILSIYGGFIFTQDLIFITWALDCVLFSVSLFTLLSAHGGGPPAMWIPLVDTALKYANIVLDIETTKMEVDGCIMAADSLIEAINDLNNRLPKVTRDTARNYAFMHADIDEPKTNYTQWRKGKGYEDNDPAWLEYLNEETGFGTFMRLTLPAENRKQIEPDLTTTVLYWWSNMRNGEWVQNETDVIVRRMAPLQLGTILYQDIASSAQLRQEMCAAIDAAPGMGDEMKWWLKAQINAAPVLLALLSGIQMLIDTFLPIYMGILDAWAVFLFVLYTLGLPWTILEWTGIGVFMGANTAYLVLTLTVLGPEAHKIHFGNIRGAMRETVPNDLTLAVEVRRRTYPMNVNQLNYDVWQMQYPLITAKSTVRMNFGSFFPPNYEYTPVIINSR